MKNVKIISIGNEFMKDDNIGLYFGDKVSKLYPEIQYIRGETDGECVLDIIEEEDYLIIIDSSYRQENLGEVGVINIDKVNSSVTSAIHFSSLPQLLHMYRYKNKGIVITIEGENFSIGTGIQEEIINSQENIIEKIKEIIKKVLVERGAILMKE